MSLLIVVAFSALGALLLVSGLRRLVTGVSLYRNEAVPVRAVSGSEGLGGDYGRIVERIHVIHLTVNCPKGSGPPIYKTIRENTI